MSNSIASTTSNDSYDYIIAGAGGAGLSLLHYLMGSSILSTKSILVIDKSFQKTNDRTWCFWEKEKGAFEALVNNRWDTISIHADSFNKVLSTAPFTYKMIQGIDFYNAILSKAKSKSNIRFQEAIIQDITVLGASTTSKCARVEWEGGAAT